MRKQLYINKEFLKKLEIEDVIFDEHGPYMIKRMTCKGPRTVMRYSVTTKHKYGKDLTYYYFALYYSGRKYNVPAADIAFLLYHPDYDCIPYGYEVDHIDNDPLNNNPDNLQLLTHAENIRKRPVACNQYRYIK